MKSDSRTLYQIFVQWLFYLWLGSFGDQRQQAEGFSTLLRELSFHDKKKSPLDSVSAYELMQMRYQKELAEIKKSVSILSVSAREEDPFLS